MFNFSFIKLVFIKIFNKEKVVECDNMRYTFKLFIVG